jgi:hypothetical protein|tara:strand:- start:91 stop:2226 length:2136 start_codon:yes stop_codon:yes gene_type:complete
MQARKRFFSGRETSLSLGIQDFSANDTVLEVTEGRVGFGTTQAAYQLTVNGDMQLHNSLYDYTNSPGEQGLSLVSTGSSVVWGTPEITFGGITVQEEGVVVGSAGSVQILNFVGDSVTADSFLGIATITVDPFDPVGDNTYVQFNDNGNFGGAEGLVYNTTLKRVAIGDTLFGSETLYVTGNVGISSELNVEKVFVSDKSPTQANELASKEYVDLFATAALVIQQAVSAGTTQNLASSVYQDGPTAGIGNSFLGIGASLYSSVNGILTVDGFTPVVDDRILVKDQTSGLQNGFYAVKDPGSGSSPWILERTQDFDQPDEIVAGAFTFVTNGNENQANGFVLIDIQPKFAAGGYVGLSALEFTQFSAAGQVEAGDGLYKDGSVINVGTANSDRIRVNADDIDLAVVSTSNTDTGSDNEKFFITTVQTDGYGRVTGIASDKHQFASYTDHGVVRLDPLAFHINPVSGIMSQAVYTNITNLNMPLGNNIGIATINLIKGCDIDTNGDILSMNNGNFLGIVTANSFSGDGSGLSNIVTGVGLATEGGFVGSGATTIDFRGPGVGVVTIDLNTGIGTVRVEGGANVDEVGNANQVLYKDNNNVATTSANLQFNGTNLTCAGQVTANSDERLKENVETITDALDKVLDLRGVFFNRIGDPERQIGVIAQEVEKVIPEVVLEAGDGVKSVAYQNIVALLIEAIKDQQLQIDELKRKLN